MNCIEKRVFFNVLIFFCLSLPFAQEGAAAEIQKFDMIARNFSFEPDVITVKVGEPVEIKITNKSFLNSHTFVLKDSEAGFSVSALIRRGETFTVKFTPPKPGTFRFNCNKFLHTPFGMVGTLVIE